MYTMTYSINKPKCHVGHNNGDMSKLQNKLKKHAKHHSKKHMAEMKKDIKKGDSFKKAHDKAMKKVGK